MTDGSKLPDEFAEKVFGHLCETESGTVIERAYIAALLMQAYPIEWALEHRAKVALDQLDVLIRMAAERVAGDD
jgi:hypothetical protein